MAERNFSIYKASSVMVRVRVSISHPRAAWILGGSCMVGEVRDSYNDFLISPVCVSLPADSMVFAIVYRGCRDVAAAEVHIWLARSTTASLA